MNTISRSLTIREHEILYYKDKSLDEYGITIFSGNRITDVKVRRFGNEYIFTIKIMARKGGDSVKVEKQIQSKDLKKQYETMKRLVETVLGR